jgi:putative photosynthetic complex assembly protein
MSEHHHTQTVPWGALIGAGTMIVFSIVLAVSARNARLAEQASAGPPPAPIESIEVRFEDRPNGAIAMLDAESGREVSEVAPGTNNFIRGVLRGMFRGRKLESLGHDGRFRLAREADGRLTLDDPQIGRHVDLDSFGPTNSAAFAKLLTDGRQAR